MAVTVGEHYNPDNPNMLVANVGVELAAGTGSSLTSPIFTAVAEAGDTSGTFTNSTATLSVTNTMADGYPAALVSINGTYAGASGVFEASDDGGTTWYPMLATRSDGTATETGYTLLTNTNRQWVIAIVGNDSVRIRSTAVASGTVNARVGVSAASTNQANSQVSSSSVTWTQSIVTLSAATSATLLAANASRKALRWMVTGTNPMTVAPGVVTVTAGQGLNYSAGSGTGQQGGADSFGPNEVSTQAFSAISTSGTTVAVWEGV